MDYGEALKIINNHVFRKYNWLISFRLVSDKDRLFEDKKVLLAKLPGLDMDTLQLYFDKMYDEGKLRGDDGVTVYFTPEYVASTAKRSYF